MHLEDDQVRPYAKVVCECCHRLIAFSGQSICPFSHKQLHILSYEATAPKPEKTPDPNHLMGG